MPLLKFTKLIDQVFNHWKKQTIRLPRKHPLKNGDTLQVYVSFKIGEATITNIESKRFDELTLDDALLDGFTNLSSLISAFKKMYPATKSGPGIESHTIVNLITFQPHWPRMRLIQYNGLNGETLTKISHVQYKNEEN